MSDPLPSYVVLDKQVGQTPLACQEVWRRETGVDTNVPLAYAGRLDPMASGKLLILVGDECKNQEAYFGLDKAYDFSVLLGIGSDTHDVLGRLYLDTAETGESTWRDASQTSSELIRQLEAIVQSLEGDIELPYPHFSSKTVQGLPLHTWAIQDRLDEIEIPTKQSTIYNLKLIDVETKTREQICDEALAKIDTVPPVTDERKAQGNDFRRTDVRADWEYIKAGTAPNCPTLSVGQMPYEYAIAHFSCICSSGTYMRTLSKVIGGRLAPPTGPLPALAWSIHRTDIGTYDPTNQTWTQEFN